MMLKDPSNAQTERFITLDAVGAQIDGGFAEYVILPQNDFKIPDHLPLELAAMVEPAAVSFQSIKDSNVREGYCRCLWSGSYWAICCFRCKSCRCF